MQATLLALMVLSDAFCLGLRIQALGIHQVQMSKNALKPRPETVYFGVHGLGLRSLGILNARTGVSHAYTMLIPNSFKSCRPDYYR